MCSGLVINPISKFSFEFSGPKSVCHRRDLQMNRFLRFYLKFGRLRRTPKRYSFVTNNRVNLKYPHWANISRRLFVPGKILLLELHKENGMALAQIFKQDKDQKILKVLSVFRKNPQSSYGISWKVVIFPKMTQAFIKRSKISFIIQKSSIKEKFRSEFSVYDAERIEAFEIGDHPELIEVIAGDDVVESKIAEDGPVQEIGLAAQEKTEERTRPKRQRRSVQHYDVSAESKSKNLKNLDQLEISTARCNVVLVKLNSFDIELQMLKYKAPANTSKRQKIKSQFAKSDNHPVKVQKKLELKPRTCILCHLVFEYRLDLYEHIHSAHNHFSLRSRMKNSEQFICKEIYCSTICESEKVLDQHHRLFHRTQRPFFCPNVGCWKTFRERETLTRHIFGHFTGNFIAYFKMRI